VATMNLLMHHGVCSCLEYAKSGDITKARALSNPDLSPHVSFVDMGGHGYTVASVTSQTFEAEFVCIPRPIERSARPDGGPLAYRVRHVASLWSKSGGPKTKGNGSRRKSGVFDLGHFTALCRQYRCTLVIAPSIPSRLPAEKARISIMIPPPRQRGATVLVNGSERKLRVQGNPTGRTIIQVDGNTVYNKFPSLYGKSSIKFDLIPGKPADLRWYKTTAQQTRISNHG
jgi:hypothetical protein